MGLFDNAEEVETTGWVAIPEGDYICRLDNMTLDLAGRFGDSFQLELVVATGEHAKRKLWQTWYLSGDYAARSLGYLKKTMSDVGLDTDVDGVEQLVDKWDSLRGNLFNVYVKQKEKQDGTIKNLAYVNSKFQGSVTDSGLPNHAPAPEVDLSEEMPF